MSAVQKARYRAPTAYASAEVSLDEFSREDIVNHLAHLDGHTNVSEGDDAEFCFSGEDISHIATLTLCGQHASAREFICAAISKRIGRTLKPA